jgi:hypothetical protein
MSVKTKCEYPAKSKKAYPKLCLVVECGLIVLFSGRSTGTVLVKGSSSWEVGHHSHNWADPQFEDIEGPFAVTFENV